MSNPIHSILMVLAFVLFLLAAFVPFGEPREPYRYRLVAAGLACWSLAIILTGFVK